LPIAAFAAKRTRTPFPQKEELKSAYLKLYQNDKTSLILLHCDLQQTYKE
jgi:hypothetical protein